MCLCSVIWNTIRTHHLQREAHGGTLKNSTYYELDASQDNFRCENILGLYQKYHRKSIRIYATIVVQIKKLLKRKRLRQLIGPTSANRLLTH